MPVARSQKDRRAATHRRREHAAATRHAKDAAYREALGLTPEQPIPSNLGMTQDRERPVPSD